MGVFHPLLHFLIYCFTNYSFIMGKVTSLYGKTSGKIGSVVFSTSAGEIIAREYNPHVANPNTEAQVNQRARMKLMSQLSSAMAPVITMQKMGLVSARNQFTKKNFGFSYVSNGEAQVSYENLQLTSGNAALPRINFGGSSGSYYLKLEQSADASISRVVWIVYRKTAEGKLQFYYSAIEKDPGNDGKFTHSLPVDFPTDNFVFFAYGMKDLNAKATAQYGELNVTTANDLATLVASRKISMTDYQFTQTRGATANNGSPIDPTPAGKVRVYVTANGNGTVSGDGLYDIGAEVTVIATAGNQSKLVGWYKNGSEQRLSTNESYTFVANETTDLIAVFQAEDI